MHMEPPIDNDDLPELPDELVEALKEDTTPLITSRVDREIETRARRAFRSRKAPARKHIPARWAAIAASFVAAILIVGDLRSPTTLYADHDSSGQIDIADVLAIAREGYSEAQIETFAMQVVSLSDDSS